MTEQSDDGNEFFQIVSGILTAIIVIGVFGYIEFLMWSKLGKPIGFFSLIIFVLIGIKSEVVSNAIGNLIKAIYYGIYFILELAWLLIGLGIILSLIIVFFKWLFS